MHEWSNIEMFYYMQLSLEWDGKLFEQWGQVLAVKSNELVKYSWFAPWPDLEDKSEIIL
ncbi:MAG: hypothetical protein V4643_07720 [Bacteroidota bacterium]